MHLLYEIFLEGYSSGKKYFFFDEIQCVEGWEKFVNRLYEKENAKVFVTGSNSSLLSSEISSVLTGRNKVLELYPLSFKEYLKTRKDIAIGASTKSQIALNKCFDDYFYLGGFPYVLKTKDVQILKDYYSNILYKDIIVRKKIRQVKDIKEISLFLMNNVGQLCSYNQIIKNSGIKSTSTIKNFIDFLSEAYLFFTVPKYDFSVRKQIQNPKKIYFIDVGMLRQVGICFSKNSWWLLENLVFLELKRQGKEIYYYRNRQGNECDFIIRQGLNITQAIQVCFELNPNTEEREIAGLVSALDEFKLKQGTIITKEKEGTIKSGGHTIRLVPISKWLLE